MKRRALIAGASVLALAGCAFGQRSVARPAVYDFGIEPPVPSATRLDASLALTDIVASAWLQTAAIVYRLAYRDAAQLQPYTLSRWAAPPAVLVTQRFRLALGQSAQSGSTMMADGVRGDYILKVEIEAFEQVVGSPDAARGLVRARVSVIDGKARSLRAQRLFSVEQPCPSVDAQGAVRALSAATDVMIAQVIDWLAVQTAPKS